MADPPGPGAETAEHDLSAPPSPADTLEQLLGRPVDDADPPAMLAPGDVLAGRFRIEKLIGAGGMGVVYLATDAALERRVAIKLHHAGAGTARLHREAVAMARLAHPNVIAVFEVGSVDGHPFVAMEYIAGQTLRAWLGSHPRSRRERLAMLLDAGAGLAAAHDAGLVHRDVKPENVLVGGDGRARVGDFGLARDSQSHDDDAAAIASPAEPPRSADRLATPLTRTGTILGTPAYMAPEQLDGHAVDARADQFAFCVAAWEILFDDRPFASATAAERQAAIARGPRKPPGARGPAAIRRVLERGLAPAPADRFADMHALLAALARAGRRRVVIAGLAAALALAGGIALAIGATRATPPSCEGVGAGAARLPHALPDQLRAAGGPLAQDGAARVSTQLDRFAAQYRELSQRACRLGVVERTWSPELYARSRGCLELRLRAAAATLTVGAIARADVPDVVEEAVALPDLTSCLDPAILAALPALPADPVRLALVVDARAELDAASTDLVIHRVARAKQRLARAQASPAAGEPGVAARIALVRGGVLEASDQLDAGEQTYRDAYFGARAIDDVEVELAAIAALIHVTGDVREHWAVADDWIRNGLADAEAARTRASSLAAGVYYTAAGVAAAEEHRDDATKWVTTARALLGDSPSPALIDMLELQAELACASDRAADCQALDHQAIALARRLFGNDHPKVANVLANAALDFDHTAPDEAQAMVREARRILDADRGTASLESAATLESLAAAMIDASDPAAATDGKQMLADARARFVAVLGPDSPEVALVDLNLALLGADAGDLVASRAQLAHALAIDERVYGADSTHVAGVLFNLATVERDQRDYAAASATIARCVAIRAKQAPGSELHGLALALAAAIANLEHRPARALELAEAALAFPALATPVQERGWASIELARALIALHRDPARARARLADARAIYGRLQMPSRVTEIDALTAALR